MLAMLLAPAAMADKNVSGGTTLYDEIEGGGTRLEDGGTVLYDAITPFGARLESNGTIFIPGLFGLFGAGEYTGFVEDPNVQNLRIRRSGANVVVEWDTNNSSARFWVFKLAAPFENAAANWTQVLASTANTSYTDANQVGAGNSQAYYRVISNSNQANVNNKVAVGKVNVDVTVGWNLISTPLLQPNGSLDQILGVDDFVDNDQVLIWNRAQQNFSPSQMANFSGGTWGDAVAAERGQGYGMNIVEIPNQPATRTLTILGNVGGEEFAGTLVTNWNQIGFPFNYAASLNNASGLLAGQANVNDQLLEWLPAEAHFKVPASTFNGTAWSEDVVLQPGIGFGYNRTGGQLVWQVPPVPE